MSIALRELGSLLPAIVAIGAALAYGVLIVSYSEFYAELGVRPSEVGLELGPGLGGIVGVTVLLILALTVLSVYALVISRWLASVSGSDEKERTRARALLVGPLIVGRVTTMLVIGWFLTDDARDAAENARRGKPVGPLTIFGLEVVGLRADRAYVSLADPKAAQTETYLGLKDRTRLMYLGRSENTLVLYNADRRGEAGQSSWRIPASMFTVRTVNCEEHVEPRHRECSN